MYRYMLAPVLATSLMAAAHAAPVSLTMSGTIDSVKAVPYSADPLVLDAYKPGLTFSATWTFDPSAMSLVAPIPQSGSDFTQFWGGDVTLNVVIPDLGMNFTHTWHPDLTNPNASYTSPTVSVETQSGTNASLIRIDVPPSPDATPINSSGASISTTEPFNGSLADALQHIDPLAGAGNSVPGYHAAYMTAGVTDAVCGPTGNYCGGIIFSVSTVSATTVPEPSVFSLALLGFVGMGCAVRRRTSSH